MPQFAKMLVLLLGIASFSFAGPVSVYGALKACKDSNGKGRICGSGAYASTPVQVKGVSLGWSNSNWESAAFFNANTVNNMVDGWRAEIIRVPMGYVASASDKNYTGSYLADKTANMNRVKAAVDAAIAKDVYVIIDWHAHTANSTDASEFFKGMASAYGSKPNVIFEIYNEPINDNWTTIKSYANTVIDIIRKNGGANNLILVGTPDYSARPSAADGNYLSDTNVGYVFHFYAATHTTTGGDYGGYPTYSNGITTVLNTGRPVFVSEYGTVAADGNGGHNPTNSDAWHTFMDNNKISSCAWHINYKNETSSFFKTSFTNISSQSPANFIDKNNMTVTGQYVYDKLVAYYNSNPPWRNGSSSASGSGNSSSSGPKETMLADFEGWGTDPENPNYNYSRLGNPFYVYKVDNATIANPYQSGSTTEYNAITSSGDSHGNVAWLKEGFNVGTKVDATSSSSGLNGTVAIGLDIKLGSLAGCTAFQYDYKGAAHQFFPNQRTHDGDSTTNGKKGDWNQPNAGANASTSWSTLTIAPADLMQSWGPTSTWVGAEDIHKLTWEIRAKSSTSSANSTQSLMIDNIKCIGANLTLPTPPGSGDSSSNSGNSGSSSSGSNSGGSSSGGSGSNASSSSGTNSKGSSSSGKEVPILTLPQVALSNSAIAFKNGINLAVKSNAAVEIFGLKGNSMRKLNFANGVYAVSFSDLPKGLYIVKVSFGSEKKILRIPVN